CLPTTHTSRLGTPMVLSLQEWLNPSTDRGVSSPLYRRSWRDSPLGVHHGLPHRGASPPLATRGAWRRWLLSLRRPSISVLFQWHRGRYLAIPPQRVVQREIADLDGRVEHQRTARRHGGAALARQAHDRARAVLGEDPELMATRQLG